MEDKIKVQQLEHETSVQQDDFATSRVPHIRLIVFSN